MVLYYYLYELKEELICVVNRNFISVGIVETSWA